MITPPRVARPPSRPVMIFDGDCNFCRRWIARWQQATGERIEYIPFQDARVCEQFPELPRERFEQAVHLIETDGQVYRAAEAVFRSLACAPGQGWSLWVYQRGPGVAWFTEAAYRLVAQNRKVFSWLTRLLWGDSVERPEHHVVRWLFLRLLGIIYFVAFVSLWTQISGLVGRNGIVPAEQVMQTIRERVTQRSIGLDRYRVFPTLCWFSASDRALQVQCATGVFLSALLIVGVAPAPVLFLLWVVYLSLTTIGGVFLSFQWDNLLLETGLLAIFFAPLQLPPKFSRTAPPSRIALWLLRWLLLRLMFESAVVKLASGDAAWHNLTALNFHYETQPLPTWIGWCAHQLPGWFQRLSVLVMFAIELVMPFLIFAPRRMRHFACVAMALLQMLILLTGNYTFFNWLTLALCVLLLEDRALAKFVPRRWRTLFHIKGASPALPSIPAEPAPAILDEPGSANHAPPATRHASRITPLRWPRWLTVPLAAVVLTVTLLQVVETFRGRFVWAEPAAALHEWIYPLRSVNHYGLFAVMTTSRPEIIVEGSDDGTAWRAYEFKYKPGDLKRRPAFVAPHQPRLDWQMWFAALGSYRGNPWFMNFCTRLLQGSPEVLELLEKNPFPNQPPHFIRARVYDYHFTNFATRRAEGTWWRRELKGDYCPTLSLREARAAER